MREGIDPRHAREALHAIDPGLPREEWHRIGRAAIAAGLTVDDLIEWSKPAPNFKDERDVRAAFRTIKPEGGTTAGTLWRAAMDAGWRPPQDSGEARQQRRSSWAEKPRHRPVTRRRAASAAEVWGCCSPATDAHPYIAAKQGTPEGLRVMPEDDPLTVSGCAVAGCLVVPVLGESGTLLSLQFVAPPELAARWKATGKPSKLNLPGAGMGDAGRFVVGELQPGAALYLVEGIGQAWACWKATGRAAVVCFGWERVCKVAQALRGVDPGAALVLVPDAGKEVAARRIAAELGAAVACMPEGSPKNFDANDYAQAEGFDALDVLLSKAAEPLPTHPLAQFVDLGDMEPTPPRWVIPGFVAAGTVAIAGAHGAGKTTGLLPLAMVAAGLHAAGDPLAPFEWRHVVYITEDPEQARRILAGIVKHGGMGLDLAAVRERLHLVEARRMEPQEVARVARTYRRTLARTVAGVEVLPLVVFDTKSAVFVTEDENDNAEASALVAVLKQNFEGLPLWLVGHVAKANMTRADAASLSVRGAGSIEGDTHQTLFLVKEGEERFLVMGKRRFEPEWLELHIRSQCVRVQAFNEWGKPEYVVLRWGVPTPPQMSREEVREQAQQGARMEEAATLRSEVLETVDAAWRSGFPLNRAGVKAKVQRRTQEVADCIENLLSERWLIEVTVPAKERANNNRRSFLTALSTSEHDAVALDGAPIPAEKLVIPASWKRPASSVPKHQGQEVQAHAARSAANA